MDRAGNLYGTTTADGVGCDGAGCGTVFELQHKGSNWIFVTLYRFQGGMDGAVPEGRVSFGPDGSLYGTTKSGGLGTCRLQPGCGVVYNLRPPPALCRSVSCPWS